MIELALRVLKKYEICSDEFKLGAYVVRKALSSKELYLLKQLLINPLKENDITSEITKEMITFLINCGLVAEYVGDSFPLVLYTGATKLGMEVYYSNN